MKFNDVVNELMHGEKIFNLPFRVVYYARVSTDSDVQLNSLDNQLNYYENYIKSKLSWTYIGGYIEEGVTGVTVNKRNSFRSMIKDAKLGKFDLIITKEVSRFARDLEDSIHYIRELKEANVGIFFENQNLNTFDPNSELILNIMFNLAQDESRKLSSRVKFGHREAIKKGHVLGSSNIIGYKKDKCKLLVVEEEAKFICKVFELYATGEYGFYKLSKKLGTLGYFNKNGNLYDKDTLKRIIENPKYKGYYRANVHEVLDYRTKKRKKNNIEEQIIYKSVDGSVPKIVSEELWDKANDILKKRSKSYHNNNYYSGGLKYPLSSKIYCLEHNCTFQRSYSSKKKNKPIWACCKYLQYRLESCLSPIISEIDILNILEYIMNKIIPNKQKISTELINLYKSNHQNNEDNNINVIDNKIRKIEEKKAFAFDLTYNNEISKDSLKQQFIKFDNEIEILNNQKEDLKKRKNLQSKNNYIDNLHSIINTELKSNILNSFIREFVDEIIVSKINKDRHNIKLDIYLNLVGNENIKQKGTKHINGSLVSDIEYLKNQKYSPIEKKRLSTIPNKFTYNVYIESI